MTKYMATALVCAALAASPLAAQSAYVVDTGANPNPTGGWTFAAGGSSLGATFQVFDVTTIGSVEGFFHARDSATIDLAISLYSGPPSDTPQFSVQSTVTGGTIDWAGKDGLAWIIQPGEYTVAFSTTSVAGAAFMPGNSLNPLAKEWFRTTGAWVQSDELDIGVRISTAVPEASTSAMLSIGLSLLFLARIASRRGGKSKN